jgi:FMN phosphatase YigB (HAD superfamily)
MFKAIIFDLYGTLIELDRNTRPYLRFARGLDGDQARRVARQSLVVNTNGIADLAEQVGEIRREGFTAYDVDLGRDIQSSRVFEDAIEVLDRLHGSVLLRRNGGSPGVGTITGLRELLAEHAW